MSLFPERIDESTPLTNKDFVALPIGEYDSLRCITVERQQQERVKHARHVVILRLAAVLIAFLALFATLIAYFSTNQSTVVPEKLPVEGVDFATVTMPYSVVDPRSLGILEAVRPESSQPGPFFGSLRDIPLPLPTNAWCENLMLGRRNNYTNNKAFQLPYIVDTAAFLPGIRANPIRMQSAATLVQMIYEVDNGMVLGAAEDMLPQHEIVANPDLAIARLSILLQWKSRQFRESNGKEGAMMYTPIVRGSPYVSTVYESATPRLYMQRSMHGDILVDSGDDDFPTQRLVCGEGLGVFSTTPVIVHREMLVTFETSDMAWLIFVSEPTEFVCSNRRFAETIAYPGDAAATNPPGWEKVSPHFDLRATKPMKRGMIRVALANNCTTGGFQAQLCDDGGRTPRNNSEFMRLLRDHADLYPTGHSDIWFAFPDKTFDEDQIRLHFDWAPASMSKVSVSSIEKGGDPTLGIYPYGPEMLTYALPHQQERLVATPQATNRVLHVGCTPTLHGLACPVLGTRWSAVEHLHTVRFLPTHPIKAEMVDAVIDALKEDIHYRLPENYMRGAGDTYYSGKMLAKLGRILLMAEALPGSVTPSDFHDALHHLKKGVEVWLNGTGEAPLLYDRHWGGIVSCGCIYSDAIGGCANKYPDCPAMYDMGQNFGAGFYNDHHFHYGYHIYAAAILSHFDPKWAVHYFQRVLLLIRDIANPSPNDPFFSTWRHKDWYLGYSWANGIVPLNPNGRNQESSSEATNAYEALALYGDIMVQVFTAQRNKLLSSHPGLPVGDSDDPNPGHDDSLTAAYRMDTNNVDLAQRIKDMGRLLFATEVRSAKLYWHVQSPGNPLVERVYPEVYEGKVVGMIWSLLAQEQTWFGNEPFKSYGIQLLPITAGSELRNTPSWVREMLPLLNASCAASEVCTRDGWSTLVYAAMSEIGNWQEAWRGIESLPDSVYSTAGGNGHSKSNSLWYIATRPDPDYNIS